MYGFLRQAAITSWWTTDSLVSLLRKYWEQELGVVRLSSDNTPAEDEKENTVQKSK